MTSFSFSVLLLLKSDALTQEFYCHEETKKKNEVARSPSPNNFPHVESGYC